MILLDGSVIGGHIARKALKGLGGRGVVEWLNGSQFNRKGASASCRVYDVEHYHVWVSGRDVSLSRVTARGLFVDTRKVLVFRARVAFMWRGKWRAWV